MTSLYLSVIIFKIIPPVRVCQVFALMHAAGRVVMQVFC